jgi:hypothetical protein
MKGTQEDVIYHPNHQKPARPVAGAEQKDRGNNSRKPDQENPDKVILEQVLFFELTGVVYKPYGAC